MILIFIVKHVIFTDISSIHNFSTTSNYDTNECVQNRAKSYLKCTNLSTGTRVYYWLHYVKHTRLQTKFYDIDNVKSSHRQLLLLISGIEPNPGPRHPKYLCGICKKACKLGTIACDECDQWLHKTCIGMSSTEYSRLGNCRWTCPNCDKPNNSSIIYATPLSNEQSYTTDHINQSEHPSLIQSESDFSFPSASSITDESRSSISSDGNSTFNILPQTNGRVFNKIVLNRLN